MENLHLTKRWTTESMVWLHRRAKATIRSPTRFLQPVDGPYVVLSKKPSEKFLLGGSPSLPNHALKKGGDGANELQLVG
jgi:hypothetical protein